MPPRLAITMGDPAGIGPETIVRAWCDERLHALSQPLVVGSAAVMARAARQFAPHVTVQVVTHPEEIDAHTKLLPCLDCAAPDAADVQPAVIDPRGGQAAYESLCEAARLALARQVA